MKLQPQIPHRPGAKNNAEDRRTAQDIEQLLWEHGLIYSRKFEAYTKEILEAIHGYV